MNPDFSVENHLTIVMLRPLSDAARNWVEENLPEDRQTFGNAVVIEHRFAADILRGIVNDGLTLQAAWAGALNTLLRESRETVNRQLLQKSAERLNGQRVQDYRVSLDEPSRHTPSGRPLCERCGYVTSQRLWPHCKPCRSGTRLLLTSTDKKLLRAMGISGR